MPTFTPDLVGFSGARIYETLLNSTRQEFTDAVAANLVSVGWTKLSGPSVVGFGDEYEFVSAQVPWYDTSNVPAWYIGGQVYIKMSHPSSNQIAFEFAEYYNSTITNVSSLSFGIAASLSGGASYQILTNPYELWITTDQTPVHSNNIYIGALNVPQPIQQKSLVISSLLAGKFAASDHLTIINQYSCFRVKDSSPETYSQNSPGNYGAQFQTVQGAVPFGGPGNYYARRLWQPQSDSGQTLPATGVGFLRQAQVAYRIASTGTSLTTNGFLWDCYIATEAYSRGAIVEHKGKLYMCYAGTTATARSKPAALMLNIGDV